MKVFACEKCGSLDVFIQEKGSQTGLYCGDCGKWIKWLSKSEIEPAKRFIEENKKTEKESSVTSSQENVFENLCKQVSDYLFKNYNPHTTVIITDQRIQIVEDKESIPIKRG